MRETTEGATTTFRYELWVPICAFLGGLVAVPAGLVLRQKSTRYGWALIILGPLAAVFLAPSVFLDRVVVDDAGIHSRTGIWGMTAVHDLKIADVSAVKIVSETSSTRRGGKKTNYFFLCESRHQRVREVLPVNNAVAAPPAPRSSPATWPITASRSPTRRVTGESG